MKRRDLSHIDPEYRNLFSVPEPMIERLKEMAKENGDLLKPEDVLEEARNPKSPLHIRFEWDDTEAAEKYRMIQARAMVSICVEVAPGSNVPRKVFVSLKSDRANGGGYRTAVSVLSSGALQRQLLEDALEQMDYFRQKFHQLQQLSSVMKAMERAAEELREGAQLE